MKGSHTREDTYPFTSLVTGKVLAEIVDAMPYKLGAYGEASASERLDGIGSVFVTWHSQRFSFAYAERFRLFAWRFGPNHSLGFGYERSDHKGFIITLTVVAVDFRRFAYDATSP